MPNEIAAWTSFIAAFATRACYRRRPMKSRTICVRLESALSVARAVA
jgi:hypothetical protein